MTISNSLDQLQLQSYIESTSVANKPGVVVLNPDGTNIGGGTGASASEIQGNASSDTADIGKPVKIGGVAATVTSLPSAVGATERVNAAYSLNGEVYAYLSKLIEGEDQTNHLIGTLPKPIAGSTYTSSSYQNNSFTTSNVKASAGNLLSFRVTNTIGANRYLQFHNTATTPAGGATAQEKFLIPAGSQVILGPSDIGMAGVYFATGIAVANSTTLTTYTAGTAGDLVVDLIYV